ncbi:hypothetical protein [Achromobacter xylosoxidans]|uniref:hypothetical protein n=1 Tax=Alcaligenes xylosoxydans xylosoxydans TaxID=85698 RepID=UPI001F12BE2B|nr:hypothetical protein [Achromobacter xylosoxidans]
MHTPVTFTRRSAATRRALAWLAAGLLVFQSLVASAALGAPQPAVAGQGTSVILCTASGPRVVALDSVDAVGAHAAAATPAQAAGHAAGGTLPHCCAASCAMLAGAGPPAFAGLAWRLPRQPAALPRASQPGPCPRGATAWLPQQSRAPPRAA